MRDTPLGPRERFIKGERVWFEYHCDESDQSQDVILRDHSHQLVRILCMTANDGWPSGLQTMRERGEAGCPIAYKVRFPDGLVHTAGEDELGYDRSDWFRPDPPLNRDNGRDYKWDQQQQRMILTITERTTMKKLTLETNPAILVHKDPHPRVMVSPFITPEYWLWRVQVGVKQAIVAFPKFGTIGCRFQFEEDCNTNLPVSETSERIYDHIKHNKGEKGIAKADCIRAIDMLREAAIASGAITARRP